MGGRTRRPYPTEYKAELVRLVREEGRSPSELAREFEPSAQSIMNWVVQAEIDDGQRGGLTTDEKAELRRLRAENRVLRMEKDLLEKAALDSTGQGNTMLVSEEVADGEVGATGDVRRGAGDVVEAVVGGVVVLGDLAGYRLSTWVSLFCGEADRRLRAAGAQAA